MENADIRAAARQNNVKLWEIAEYLGIWDTALSRKLRRELSKEQKDAILEAIHAIASGGVKNA